MRAISSPIRVLHVFYDAECGLCRACRSWLESQPKFAALSFTPYQSPEAERICPGLGDLGPDREIVVRADNGDVYQGSRGWIMCLRALRDYRELSNRLSGPDLLPLARRVVYLVSKNRLRFSRLLGRGAGPKFEGGLRATAEAGVETRSSLGSRAARER